MVDRIQKLLNTLRDKEKQQILMILEDVAQGKIMNYDLKKLKGHEDVYRIRKGKWRIIFYKRATRKTTVLVIERRGDTTYNF